jgi:hypothetical protein
MNVYSQCLFREWIVYPSMQSGWQKAYVAFFLAQARIECKPLQQGNEFESITAESLALLSLLQGVCCSSASFLGNVPW